MLLNMLFITLPGGCRCHHVLQEGLLSSRGGDRAVLLSMNIDYNFHISLFTWPTSLVGRLVPSMCTNLTPDFVS